MEDTGFDQHSTVETHSIGRRTVSRNVCAGDDSKSYEDEGTSLSRQYMATENGSHRGQR